MLNIILALVLVSQFEANLCQGAFGVANTISSTLNAALLWRALRRKEELAPIALPGLRKQLPVMALTAALVGGVGWWLSRELGVEQVAVGARLKVVFLPILGAGILYWVLSALAGMDSPKAILGIFRPTNRE